MDQQVDQLYEWLSDLEEQKEATVEEEERAKVERRMARVEAAIRRLLVRE